MVLPHVALRLLAATALLAGVAIAGGAVAATADAPAPNADVTAAAPVADTAVPSCARKVKVVYAGYGEAERAGCAVTAKVND